MEAHVEPHVLLAVDMRESCSADVVAAVFVDALDIRGGRDGVVGSRWEGPGAPLLGVVYSQRVGD